MKICWNILLLLPTVFSFNLTDSINNTYQGILERNIFSYPVHLVHRPYSEFPNDIVSEGLGYGLLCAVFMNDRHTFETLMNTAESYMWSGHYYNWHLGENGQIMGYGAATDADQDVAFSLILACRKINAGEWPDQNLDFYQRRIHTILNAMWDYSMIAGSGLLCPGANWGCGLIVNPSYFSPAWYRAFAEFDPQHNWRLVIEANYQLLANAKGFNNGLVPDWTNSQGGYANSGDLGYNVYGDGHYFFKDGIRTLWRIGLDYLWNGEERARIYLDNAVHFLRAQGGAPAANFFRTEPDDKGSFLLPVEDTWIFDGGQKTRPRREHSPMTIAMWSIPFALLGTNEEKLAFQDELALFYEPGKHYWGKTSSPDGEDIQHNEMYFDQFLTIFGALILDQSLNATSAPQQKNTKIGNIRVNLN
jgi:hypothetical protein